MAKLIPFNYNENEIRILQDENGDPWWVAKDVCQILDIKDVPDSMTRLDEDEKLMRVLPVSGQNRKIWTINEPGLYTLIFRSNKEEAKPFKRWIAHEVLPAIRKTGTYSMPEHEPETLLSVSKEFKAAMTMAKAAGLKGNQAAIKANHAVKRITGVNCLDILGATQLICEKQELHLTATELGKKMGLTAQKTNRLLEAHGLIESSRDHKNRLKWKPTPKGKAFTVLKDTGKKDSEGTPVQQLFYLESIKTEAQKLGMSR